MTTTPDNSAQPTPEPRPYYCPRCGQVIFEFVGDVIILGGIRFTGAMRIKHGGGCDGRVEWRPGGNGKGKR